MFLILKTTDWKEENYIKSGIVPFGWCEDCKSSNRRTNLLEKLNNKYTKHLRGKYV